MSSSVRSSNVRLSCSLKEEVMVSKKQGIVSILGSDGEKTIPATSLRRTFSADMSSKKWQSQHGFSPLKKIASSGQFPVSITDSTSSSSSSQLEEDYESQVEKGHKDHGKAGQFDTWASILSQKAQDDSKPLAPPYVHPLVRRSGSCLSDKSLEICTESLGSETGSDGFSSYPPSETGDVEEDKEDEEEREEKATSKYDTEYWSVTKHNLTIATSKKSSPKAFPPPLPSLSRCDGASLLMRPRRSSGRLVLEAVSVPSQSNFRAQREDGRLVLIFVNDSKQEEEEVHEKGRQGEDVGLFEIEMENSENEKELGEDYPEIEEEEMEIEVKETRNERRGEIGGKNGDVRFLVENAPKLSSGVMNFHRLAQVLHKPSWLSYRNQTWHTKLNEKVPSEEGANEVVSNPVTTPLTRSLPPRPPMARMLPTQPPAVAVKPAVTGASSLNAYECYWKLKLITTEVVSTAGPISPKSSPISSRNNNKIWILSKNIIANDAQDLQLPGKNKNGDYLVPWSKGCKESRRSLLYREPYCIAS